MSDKTEREYCEAVAEKIIREGWGLGFSTIHRGLADIIQRERAAARREALLEIAAKNADAYAEGCASYVAHHFIHGPHDELLLWKGRLSGAENIAARIRSLAGGEK
jgi:hypothetical protein